MKIKLKREGFEFVDLKKVNEGVFKVDYIKKVSDGVLLMTVDKQNRRVYKLYLKTPEWSILKEEMKENYGRMVIEKGHDINIVFYTGEKGEYRYNKEKERFEFLPENEIIEF